jgi:hypothetical protein
MVGSEDGDVELLPEFIIASTLSGGDKAKRKGRKSVGPAGPSRKVSEPSRQTSSGSGPTLAEQLAAAERRNKQLTKQLERRASQMGFVQALEMDKQQKKLALLEQDLLDAHEARRQLMMSNATRLMRITRLETELQKQRDLQRETQAELEEKGRMLQLVLTYRDKQLTREMAELLHENSELTDAAERWKERATSLAHERRGHVQRWRAEQLRASQAGAAGQDKAGATDSEEGEEGGEGEEGEEGEQDASEASETSEEKGYG